MGGRLTFFDATWAGTTANTAFVAETAELFELSKPVAQQRKPAADKRKVTINVLGGSNKITGVEKILEEILYNLVDNAVKYNKDGGVADVILTSTDEEGTLMVRDTGIGISPADQPRVFERFYCVDKSRSKTIGGTGLGLSIVKHGAPCRNARITLKSVVDRGTTVTVCFAK